MTDQPIASSEVAEQLSSLSDALDSKISTISEFLARAEQLCQSAQQAEAAVAATRQEIMGAVAGASIDGTITDRVAALEARLGELLQTLPRLAQDVKNYARLAQHMDQCANEVNQWYQELQEAKKHGATDSESHLLEMQNALESYRESHQALAEQVALLQSRGDNLGVEYAKEADLSALERRVAQLEAGEARIQHLINEPVEALRNEMNAIQRDWQDGAAILQQMQVRIESLEGKGGDATTAQLEALRSEMANLVARAKTEQETALREQRKRLEELGNQGGKTTIALILGVIALGVGIVGVAR